MKTPIFIIACLSLSFFACNQDSELVTKDDLGFTQIDTGNTAKPDVDRTTDIPSNCIGLATTHKLAGVGHFIPVRETLGNDQKPNSVIAGEYLISASGDAFSDAYARGFSKLTLVYIPRSKQLTGTLITDFFNGEILNVNMDGVARVRYDAKTMTLTVKVTEATLNISTDVLKLDNGEISIVLPVKPEGQFAINMDSKEILCKS